MTNDSEKIEIAIPEEHQQICREIAAIAKKHGLRRLSATYDAAVFSPWRGQIQLSWEAGRHGADSNKLYVSSTMNVHTFVEDEL